MNNISLKDLQHKVKSFKLPSITLDVGEKIKRRQSFKLPSITLDVGDKSKRKQVNTKKASWMNMPISHGSYIVQEGQFFRSASDHDSNSDWVVVQREEIEDHELWFFGVFDAQIGDHVTKYMQTNFFDKKPKEMSKKSKEMMKKAFIAGKAKIKETHKVEEKGGDGGVSAMVINGEKLVLANMGDYRAIVCRNGVAYQIGTKHSQSAKSRWPSKLISERQFRAKSENAINTMQTKTSELIVSMERIDYDTEFVILASSGIWEVMSYQEGVDFIRHIEHSQEAAECLAKEAVSRMSRSNMSCLVIRFD